MATDGRTAIVARELLDRLAYWGTPTFARRDIHQVFRHDAEDDALDDALSLLERLGYVRRRGLVYEIDRRVRPYRRPHGRLQSGRSPGPPQ